MLLCFTKKCCTKLMHGQARYHDEDTNHQVAHKCGRFHRTAFFNRQTTKLPYKKKVNMVLIFLRVWHYECSDHKMHVHTKQHFMVTFTGAATSTSHSFVHNRPLYLAAKLPSRAIGSSSNWLVLFLTALVCVRNTKDNFIL